MIYKHLNFLHFHLGGLISCRGKKMAKRSRESLFQKAGQAVGLPGKKAVETKQGTLHEIPAQPCWENHLQFWFWNLSKNFMSELNNAQRRGAKMTGKAGGPSIEGRLKDFLFFHLERQGCIRGRVKDNTCVKDMEGQTSTYSSNLMSSSWRLKGLNLEASPSAHLIGVWSRADASMKLVTPKNYYEQFTDSNRVGAIS